MNTLEMRDVKYLRSDRTIETVRLTSNGRTKTVFVYNYEGVHFRVFDNISDVYMVVSGGSDNIRLVAEFEREENLDDFLVNFIKV